MHTADLRHINQRAYTLEFQAQRNTTTSYEEKVQTKT